jgi:hypothetical protein
MNYPITRSLTRMTTMLFEPHQARRWNCAINLYLKVFLRKIDPANGAATGTAADWNTTNAGGPRRNIVRWAPGAFEAWAARYQRECQQFWDNRFWLCPPMNYAELDFRQNLNTLRPNAHCGLYLTLVSGEALADHTIDVVRLADSEPFYRSDSRHYDHRDIEPSTSSAGFQQRAHVHEVGHLLTLGHSNEGDSNCVNHNPICYANDNVMGGGEMLATWNARPWQDAMQAVTGISSSQWRVSMSEVIPQLRLP